MLYVFYLAVLVLLLGAVWIVVWGTRAGPNGARIAPLDHLRAFDQSEYGAELARPATQRLLKPALARLGAASRAITPRGRIRRLEVKIERAGHPRNLDVNGLLALKLASLGVGLVILIILAALKLLPALWFVVLAVVVAAGTYYLPDLILRFSIDTRKRLIARALPDFLDLLTVTVEAGLGLDSALAKIAERLRDPLREEILLTLYEIRMGKSREAALREFARRCDVEDLNNFVSALIQSLRLGISLGSVLRTQSNTIRTLQRQRVEERAQKTPVKMLIPLIFCIFPALMITILGPAAIRIYHTLLG
jgi:tight adherence protein C